jgi:hypothetical protein
VVRVAARPLPVSRQLRENLEGLGEPLARLAVWPEGYSVFTRMPAEFPLLWLQTEYPVGKLPHMWAAGDLLLGNIRAT